MQFIWLTWGEIQWGGRGGAARDLFFACFAFL
jgi:hypothetical protein